MAEKEYIVTLKAGVDYNQFNQEMIKSTGAGNIPSRSVDVANARPGSLRNTHYALTSAEVDSLKNDPRVEGIELPIEHNDRIILTPGLREENINIGTGVTGDVRDWAKPYHNSRELGVLPVSRITNFDYNLDGTSVDVVIVDSGIQADHPEFEGRMKQIDWYDESKIISGFQSSNHYRDYDGHGTHVAGTVAGTVFGWAKGAHVYSLKLSGLEGSGDSGNGISSFDAFDLIKLWHRNKPLDPITRQKRPTVVNMSFVLLNSYSQIDGIIHRGISYDPISNPEFDWSLGSTDLRNNFGLVPYTRGGTYYLPLRSTSLDTDIQEMIDEGIHVVVAAGNNEFKHDLSTGDDYDNILDDGIINYYHRGHSPYNDLAFNVGAIAYTSSGSWSTRPGFAPKTLFSCTGPAVNIYAAGDDITSAMSNNNPYQLVRTYRGGTTGFFQARLDGTSMASPQVAGVAALFLQANPGYTPAQLQERMFKESEDQMYATTSTSYSGGTNTLSDAFTVMNGPQRRLINPYNNVVSGSNTVSGNYNIKRN